MTESVTNRPELWRAHFPVPGQDSHKYSRGTALIKGGEIMTGASRLAARAAQRIGAGLVTIAAPSEVLPIYAEALESVIIKPCDTLEEWENLIGDKHTPTLLLGPGLGVDGDRAQEIKTALLAKRATVIDADVFSNFAASPEDLFSLLHPQCVLTPHEGEFSRLFHGIAGSRVSRASQAAKETKSVVLLKGFETVIASPDGQIVINKDAPPWLATAGSGDVLSGMILGLAAQKMSLFEAACAAAWMHARIADRHGPGLIAEDVVAGIPAILQELIG